MKRSERKSPLKKRPPRKSPPKIPDAYSNIDARNFMKQGIRFHFNHPDLQSLDLSKLRLRKIPTWITQFRQITFLALDANNISSIPAGIRNLSNLEEFYLSYNDFTIFPIEVTSLENLKKLHITFNKITYIPSEVNRLVKLTELSLDGNPLEAISYKINPSLLTDVENATELQKIDKIEQKVDKLTPLKDYNIHTDYVKKLLLRQ